MKKYKLYTPYIERYNKLNIIWFFKNYKNQLVEIVFNIISGECEYSDKYNNDPNLIKYNGRYESEFYFELTRFIFYNGLKDPIIYSSMPIKIKRMVMAFPFKVIKWN